MSTHTPVCDLSVTLIHLKGQQRLQTSLPVLSRGQLLPHVVQHIHLLLVWSKHLEASAVTAQVVHGAEDRVVSYDLSLLGAVFLVRNKMYKTILTTLPHGHQSHPTSHILRTPGSHCDSQITVMPPTIFSGP